MDLDSVPDVPAEVSGVAVCLLHADLEPAHERAVAAVLRARGLQVTCSHEVSPEIREYERMVTTAVNASLEPLCRAYLQDLDDLAELGVGDDLGRRAPPGGVRPTLPPPCSCQDRRPVCERPRRPPSPTAFRMPSPSTWGARARTCAWCWAGSRRRPRSDRSGGTRFGSRRSTSTRSARVEAPSPPSIPGVPWWSRPRSAGARPAPRATGTAATSPPSPTPISSPAASPSARASAAWRSTAMPREQAMARAGLRRRASSAWSTPAWSGPCARCPWPGGSIPRGLALVAFGGAGPLHACALAEALDMAAVIVPARAGVLSAVGLLTAPVQRDLVQSWPRPQDHTGLELACPDSRSGPPRSSVPGPPRPRPSTAATRGRATS